MFDIVLGLLSMLLIVVCVAKLISNVKNIDEIAS